MWSCGCVRSVLRHVSTLIRLLHLTFGVRLGELHRALGVIGHSFPSFGRSKVTITHMGQGSLIRRQAFGSGCGPIAVDLRGAHFSPRMRTPGPPATLS